MQLFIRKSWNQVVLASRVRTLKISNEEMNDIMKTVKSLEESGLLIKGVCQRIKNEGKEQKGGFLGMLLGTLLASLLENLLTGKGAKAMSQGREAKLEQMKAQLKLVKKQLEQVKISNAASFFNKFRNKKVLSKRT